MVARLWEWVATKIFSMTEVDKALAKRIGERVRFLRTVQLPVVSQESLADRAEMTAVYLGQVERGEKRVTVATFARIVGALDLKLSDFFVGIGE